MARAYWNLLEDATRVMLRLMAPLRARGIRTGGRSAYEVSKCTEWLAKLGDPRVRLRAMAFYAELKVLQALA